MVMVPFVSVVILVTEAIWSPWHVPLVDAFSDGFRVAEYPTMVVTVVIMIMRRMMMETVVLVPPTSPTRAIPILLVSAKKKVALQLQ
jgi:hypothetical protein